MEGVTRRRCGWRWRVLTLGVIGLAGVAHAGEAEDWRTCLPSRGTDPSTPPAVRLSGAYRMGTSGDTLRDIVTGATATLGRYVPGAADAAGPTRWLTDGVAEAQAGHLELAQQHFTRCTAEAAQAKDGLVGAACQNNLGAVAASRGLYAEARTEFERAAAKYRTELDSLPSEAALQQRQAAFEARMQVRGEATAAAMKASAPRDTGRPLTLAEIQALRDQQMRLVSEMQRDAQRDPEVKMLTRDRYSRVFMRSGTELVALNLGNVAYALGQWEEALGHFKQALAGYDGPLPCRPAALDELLRLRDRLPKKDEVTALVERYRRAVKPAPDKAGNDITDMGVLALGATAVAAGTVAAPAATPAAARKSVGAAGPDPESGVKLFADPLGGTSEAGLQDLLARAARDERAGQAALARRSFGIAALRAQAGARTEIEATAQASLMRLEADAGRPASAIFHGKRAANLLQELRSSAAALPRNARRTYLREREQTYSRLAQLLMQSRRLVEAERVLQMLKEDEGQQFSTGTRRVAYASLPETAQEAAQRARMENASQALRRSDEERAAVGADRTFAVLLAADLARLERDRLRAATELQAFLDRSGKSGAAEQEKALRALPLEYQQAFADLFADRGQRFTAMLRALNEDAPKFKATPATPQQLAAAADNLRRVEELRAVLAPVLQAMRREPSPTMATMLERELDPERMKQKAADASRQHMEQIQATQRDPQATARYAALSAAMMQTGAQQWAGTQAATGLAMTAYMAALGGQEDRASLAKVEPALKGASPEALDAFLEFVRQQGQQMQAARQSAPQVRAQLAGQSPELFMAPASAAAALAARLRGLLKPGKDKPDTAALPPPAALVPAAPAPVGDASVVSRVQAQLEAAVERARATAGPSIAETSREQLAGLIPTTPRKNTALEPPALVMAEPMGRLWRIDQAREALEGRSVDTLAQAADKLEAAQDPLPASADESAAPLAALGVPTALLYYLPSDGGVDALLIGPKGRQTWRLPLPRAELDRLTKEFSAALRDPTVDPRPAAAALHDRLFAPVAGALKATGVQVVALSLSGSLRFVPFAALYDGQGWLAERFAFALNPGGRLSDVLKPVSASWQVAAFGASKGGANLPPLQGVPQELDSIVQRGSRGALPGQQWLDAAFTAQALRAALAGGNQVVHIASHFKFEPGDAAQSFLLLGDGQRLSLQDLGGAGYRFDRTELVTLSACQTGVSSDDAFGQEVDGLAALLLGQGAPSVLASLWQVADGSTAQLMGTMYGLHAQRAQHPQGRALALQQAQLAMIRGTAVMPVGDEGARRGIDRPQATGTARTGRALGSAHPYHWAPFVLMGSWL